MKISKKTLSILKNFSTINQSIVIKPGNIIETISNVKDMFAKVEVEEVFPVQVSIYDLNEFLGVVSLFDDPDFEFTDNQVMIKEGNQKQVYFYADSSVITQSPENGIVLPSVEVTGSLDRDTLVKIAKAASVNASTHITFINGNVKVHNEAVPNSNSFLIEDVVSTEGDYNLSIGVDKLKMVADDYNIEICSKGLTKFTGAEGIVYFAALTTGGHYAA